jgi:exodeoxyribonuclease VII large subunit
VVSAGPAGAAPPAPRVWGVAALLLAVGDTLGARFAAVAVEGELAGFARAASGHCYFSLKDADGGAATLRCAMFRRAAALLDFAPREGQRVSLRGRLAVYEPRGELQFVAESMQAAGQGSLYEQFLRLKARLEAQGLFDPARKRPLPAYPRAVGVVTSPAAAALHDVLAALARRSPQVRVVVYPAAVQGAAAPDELVAALASAARRREVDVLLVCRGGGSLEDLWAFNDERVVCAIAASPLPVVCGVGHETDVTLADFAADLRAPTPTAAAELAAPAQREALAALAALVQRLRRTVQRALERHAQRLDQRGLQLARPAAALAAQRARLAALAPRLDAALRRDLERRAARPSLLAARLHARAHEALRREAAALAAWQARVSAADPAQVLTRGYAWVSDEARQPLVSAAAAQPGQRVQIRWADGEAGALLETVRRQGPPAQGPADFLQ